MNKQIEPLLTVYIAGPMSGYPEYNYPAFHRKEEELASKGYRVINPARNFDGRIDLPYSNYLRKAVENVLEVDMVALLPGWEQSAGATLEVAVALALDLLVVDSDGRPFNQGLREFLFGSESTETVLQEADRLVSTDRQSHYGHPFDNFTQTGRLWAALLNIPDISPEMVANMMIALKLSRLCNSPKRDSVVDIAGYAKTYDLVRHRRAELDGEEPYGK